MTTAEADSETALKKPVWVRSRFGCVMITVILILLLLLLALVIYFTSRNFRVQIDVGCGPERKVEGLVEDDGYVFRGLRYAKPPVGNLRWKPSVQTTVTDCMNGTYFAHEFKSECAQKDLNTGQISGSEDCLFINVWTPTTDKNANLPVMVFIHGGYLLVLSGNTPGYSPTIKMAVDANIVHVSFNYRLNAFGFMALESLSKQDFGFSGNYGLHDQIVALQWIQDNIHHFGGNPGHVTIYGHSSGATSVFALLSTKRSEGLFHRAIMIGGSSVYDKSLEDASEDNLKFVENAGCQGKANLDEEYECLMELTVEEILNAVTYHEYPSWLGDGSAFDLPTKGILWAPFPSSMGH
ncbi:neurotactin-like [Ptychodera flava]|uniref:neurotactin-like n=1 Tax=Ptychodera flava TaxID=63121 RepID=UPI00396A64D9